MTLTRDKAADSRILSLFAIITSKQNIFINLLGLYYLKDKVYVIKDWYHVGITEYSARSFSYS